MNVDTFTTLSMLSKSLLKSFFRISDSLLRMSTAPTCTIRFFTPLFFDNSFGRCAVMSETVPPMKLAVIIC